MTAIRAAGPAADPQDWAGRLGDIRSRFSQAQFAQAEPLACTLLDDAVQAAAWDIAAEAALTLAKGHANRGDPRQAEQWADRAAAHAARAGAPALEAAAWVVLASERARLQQPAAAMQAIGQVLQRMAAVDDARAVATVFTGVALAYEALGLPLQALAAARRALSAGLVLADDTVLLRLRVNVVTTGLAAWDQIQAADATAAAQVLDELQVQLQAIDSATAAFAARGLAGRSTHDFIAAGLRLRRGEAAAAQALLQPLIEQARDLPPLQMCEAWLMLAEAERIQGDRPAAQRAAEAARTIADQLPRGSAGEQERQARIEALCGQPELALQLLRRHHAQQLASVRAALDARIDELAAQLVTVQLRDENRQLRAHNRGLEASVEQISRLATTDTLAGLANRRALETGYAALAGAGQPLALAVLDLDHFKSVNDRYSHGVGDAVLSQAAARMAASLRAPDLLARYGGEEFVAVLAGVDLTAARSVLERVRLAVREHDWSRLGAGLQVTVSIGLTLVRPGEALDTALARADAQLYAAKHGGRDRVCCDDDAAG